MISLYKINAELTQCALYINHYSEGVIACKNCHTYTATDKTILKLTYFSSGEEEKESGIPVIVSVAEGEHCYKVFAKPQPSFPAN